MKAQPRLAGGRRKLGRNGFSSDIPRECVDPPEYLRDLRDLQNLERGDNVGIQHVRSHTGNRGNDAADKLAKMGAEIEEGHRVVERGSAEPPLGRDEHKDNG